MKVKIGLWNSLDLKGREDINFLFDILDILIYNVFFVFDFMC